MKAKLYDLGQNAGSLSQSLCRTSTLFCSWRAIDKWR